VIALYAIHISWAVSSDLYATHASWVVSSDPGALPLAVCPRSVRALTSAGTAGQMLLVNAARACGDAAAAARALAAVLATMEAVLGVPTPELGNLVALQARLLGIVLWKDAALARGDDAPKLYVPAACVAVHGALRQAWHAQWRRAGVERLPFPERRYQLSRAAQEAPRGVPC
jgi:hypothetical protein